VRSLNKGEKGGDGKGGSNSLSNISLIKNGGGGGLSDKKGGSIGKKKFSLNNQGGKERADKQLFQARWKESKWKRGQSPDSSIVE